MLKNLNHLTTIHLSSHCDWSRCCISVLTLSMFSRLPTCMLQCYWHTWAA